MSKLSDKESEKLKALAARPDAEIDTSDIPALSELPKNVVVGKFFRPIKQSVTVRLDADVLDWLKGGGAGYQTRINTYLREAMHKRRKAS